MEAARPRAVPEAPSPRAVPETGPEKPRPGRGYKVEEVGRGLEEDEARNRQGEREPAQVAAPAWAPQRRGQGRPGEGRGQGWEIWGQEQE